MKNPNNFSFNSDENLEYSPDRTGEILERPLNRSDETVEKVFDKIGRGPEQGYFKPDHKIPNILSEITKHIAEMPVEKVTEDFKTDLENYSRTKNPDEQQKIQDFYRLTAKNINDLSARGLVKHDTVKVFLIPDCVANKGHGDKLMQYSMIQSDFSRYNGQNWMSGPQTADRYNQCAKELADSFVWASGDVMYQGGQPYDPQAPLGIPTYIHVNANKPRTKSMLRCYISSNKTADPAAVFYAWNKTLLASPLRDSLYFKFCNCMSPYDNDRQRPDDLLIYKSDHIDDDQFKTLLQDFRQYCNQLSPDLLPSEEGRTPAVNQKIANGISIAGEPDYINDYMTYTGNRDARHSWTTFVDKMLMLSASLAENRLGIQANSIEAPGLEDETKKVFREFMLLSRINPDTMLPVKYGDQLPAWTKLDE